MKSPLAIVLFLLYTVALIRPVYPLLDYMVRLQAYQQRCVNKARPGMHCNGQCVLMQKLRALNREEPDPVAPVPPKINPDDFPLCLAAYTPTQTTPFTPRSASSISLDAAHPRTFIVDIFRPPKA